MGKVRAGKLVALCVICCAISAHSLADPGDLFVQVSDDYDGACTIMRVPPSGNPEIWLSKSTLETHLNVGNGSVECANDGLTVTPAGDLYFSVSDEFALIHADANKNLTTILDASDLATALNVSDTNSDLDFENGLAWMNGALYTTAEDGSSSCGGNSCDYLLSVTNLQSGNAQINILADETAIRAVSNDSGTNLAGGVAADTAGKVYFVDDGDDGTNQAGAGVYVYDTSTSSVSKLISETQLVATPGMASSTVNTDLDVDIALSGNQLIILDDEDDYIFKHNLHTNQTEIVITEQELVDDMYGANSYINGDDSGITTDMEGGLAVGADGTIYLSDDGNDDQASIMTITPDGTASSYVSTSTLDALYGYDRLNDSGFEPQFRAGTDMQFTTSQFARMNSGSTPPPPSPTVPVPTVPSFFLLLIASAMAWLSQRMFRVAQR